MTPRRRKPAATVPGLRRRGGILQWEVRHPRLDGGRMVVSLRTDDMPVALERVQAVRTLMDRGDWVLIARLRSGEVHITDVVAAVREGTVSRLRRNHHDRATLGPTVERYLRRKEGEKKRAGTLRTYRGMLDQLLAAFPGDTILAEVTRDQVEAFLHRPRKGGHPWSARTQALMTAVAGAVWEVAIEQEAERARTQEYVPSLTVNPWREVTTPEIAPTRAAFLSPEEWRALARSMSGRPEAALLGCAYLAGLRGGEIRHLRPGIDVDLEHADGPVIHVQPREGAHPWAPKNKRGVRTVPVSAELLDILGEHARLGYSGRRYLIRLPQEDQPISYTTSREWTRRAYERVGIRYGSRGDALTLHSGRHTFASWLAQSRVPLNIVAALLGDTLKMVDETYAHLVPNTLRDAVDELDGMLDGDTKNNGSANRGTRK